MIITEGHPIRVVARRTGLSTHVIRIWEKRYHAVIPSRSESHRRLYSDEDIMRLRLLRDLTRVGRSIGQIANMPTDRLKELLTEDEVDVARVDAGTAIYPPDDTSAGGFFSAALEAVIHFDDKGLEAVLSRAAVELSQTALMEKVIVPLLYEIGELWHNGSLRIAQEHAASAVLRTFIGNLASNNHAPDSAPHITVATPSGQGHEYGALVVAAAAAADGWRVTYLGPSLPTEEIAGAAHQKGSKVVALSLVYPNDDPKLVFEIEKLRRSLSADASLIVGGQAADSYREALLRTGVSVITDIAGLRTKLRELRRPEES